MFAARKTDNVSSAANYIEDVFSTYLFSGNSASQTITNGIDLSGKGGMVWFKDRTLGSNHRLTDTVRGSGKSLLSNSTAAEQTATGNGTPTSFSSTGFVTDVSGFGSSDTYVTWTFRKQAKFFDVVTYTGNGTTQNIAHSLGGTVGCLIIKRTDANAGWYVWHRGQSAGYYSILNTTAAETNSVNTITFGNNTTYVDPTSTQFTVGSNGNINGSGNTYVAYLFAHNAGGFGAAGADNVISCGSFTTDASGSFTAVNLGYEPQWLLFKRTDSSTAGVWTLLDNMRGFAQTGNRYLEAQSSAAESAGYQVVPLSTGFGDPNNSGPLSASATYIYIAIRRGPMKTPTSGTSVFLPALASSSGTYTVTTNFPVDSCWYGNRTNGDAWYDFDRLRGNPYLKPNTTAAEVASSGAFDSNVNFRFTTFSGNASGYINYAFQRAPGFFDVVCYTGTGSALAVNHNLGVAPELVIWKARNQTGFGWKVTCVGLTNPDTYFLTLNATNAQTDNGANFIYNRTATTVTFAPDLTNAAYNNVVYLFATVAGVSKVGSYTGTGALQTINCGFSTGARFILIKRTDSTGDWWVYDSTRGITSGNDPYMFLNSTAAEVTNTNYVDTTSVGFRVTAAAPAGLNANGGTYIFLAIS